MTDTQEKPHVVILGAGVIGLTIAHVLTTRYPGKYKITIVARELPQDLHSQSFSSPWAGANWSPFGEYDEKTYKRESVTFNKFWDMESTGLVYTMPSTIYYPAGTDLEKSWYKDLVRNFRILSSDELPEGAEAGTVFSTITVNPKKYLPWLTSELESSGVEFVRRQIQSIGEAANIVGEHGLVFNATGLGAKSLIGVADPKVYPIRGQTITVYAPEVKECKALPLTSVAQSDTEATYMIPRPSPDGHVILGGTYQKNNWDLSVDFETASRIWNDAVKYTPALKTDKTKIVSHNVGLRPSREGGPRIELEYVDVPVESDILHGHSKPDETKRKLPVIHAYGFGGAGYQGSWGAAEEAVDLLPSSL